MNAIEPLNITVMLGGFSEEREVSLRSGAAVAKALGSLGHQVSELDPSDENWVLPANTDVVFIALHGTYGEDGAVQSKLETLGIPFTGSDASSSQLAFDKAVTKQALVKEGLPTPTSAIIENLNESFPEGLEFPVILKPVSQGSSVGLQFVESEGEWSSALREAFKHGDRILLESKINGREITIGILAGEALPIVEVRPREGGYDYHNKYTAGATDHFCPASFSEETTLNLQRTALTAFYSVRCRDYGRVDIIVQPDGSPMILEVNTLPGMTELSLFPEAAAAAGIDFRHLCQKMIDLAMARSKVESVIA